MGRRTLMSKNNDLLYAIEDQLEVLKLKHMSEALDEMFRSKDFIDMDKMTVIARMVEAEYDDKAFKLLDRHLKDAHLKGAPQELELCVDSKDREYLPLDITKTLSTLDFINEGLNVCILGPSDSGKSYLAKALGIEACAKYKVGYVHCESFLEEMVSLKETSFEKYQKKMRKHVNKELFILDDFLLHTLTDEREIKVLYELLETRSELSRSTIVCSQREPSSWTAMMLNDKVSANAISKRAARHYTVVINPKNT